jgi:hypothetical protein
MTTPTHLSQHMTDEAAHASRVPRRADEDPGWADFAAVMILAAALFNAVYGFAALANDDLFRSDELLFGDLSAWGAVFLAVAALQAVAALLIFRRSGVGAVLGIALAGLNGLVTLMAVEAYPLWSMLVLAVDVLVIYALAVHGFGDGTRGAPAGGTP